VCFGYRRIVGDPGVVITPCKGYSSSISRVTFRDPWSFPGVELVLPLERRGSCEVLSLFWGPNLTLVCNLRLV